jgi:hypothetical protein
MTLPKSRTPHARTGRGFRAQGGHTGLAQVAADPGQHGLQLHLGLAGGQDVAVAEGGPIAQIQPGDFLGLAGEQVADGQAPDVVQRNLSAHCGRISSMSRPTKTVASTRRFSLRKGQVPLHAQGPGDAVGHRKRRRRRSATTVLAKVFSGALPTFTTSKPSRRRRSATMEATPLRPVPLSTSTVPDEAAGTREDESPRKVDGWISDGARRHELAKQARRRTATRRTGPVRASRSMPRQSARSPQGRRRDAHVPDGEDEGFRRTVFETDVGDQIRAFLKALRRCSAWPGGE